MTHRVVVTGAAGICPLGSSWNEARGSLAALRNCVRRIEQWENYEGLNTKLGAPVSDFSLPAHYQPEQTRSMGRVAQLAVRATEIALTESGLLNDPALTDGSTGVAYGSCTGSTDEVAQLVAAIVGEANASLSADAYIRHMSHTAAININRFFKLKGRVIPTPSACTAGSQSIGYACEAIRSGRQTAMIAGGAEELCASEAAVFDVLYATSTANQAPQSLLSLFR